MATYQIQTSAQFNGTYDYPFINGVAITPSVEPLKRVVELDDAAETPIFTRTKAEATVIITNRGTNDARIRFAEASGETVDILLRAGRQLMMPSSQISVDDSEGSFVTFSAWDEVMGECMDGETEVEVLVIQEEEAQS